MTKKSINIENLFSIFNEGIQKYDEVYDDFMANPYVKIKMFIKTIQNNENFQQNVRKYMNMYKLEYNEEELTLSTYTLNFNRAFSYISQINIKNEIDRDALNACFNSIFLSYINEILKFFEIKEEYEKCAVLLPIKSYLESLASLKDFA